MLSVTHALCFVWKKSDVYTVTQVVRRSPMLYGDAYRAVESGVDTVTRFAQLVRCYTVTHRKVRLRIRLNMLSQSNLMVQDSVFGHFGVIF